MCQLNDKVFIWTKCLGSMFKFNASVNCVTKNCQGSIPKFSVQAQCACFIWHTLGNTVSPYQAIGPPILEFLLKYILINVTNSTYSAKV